LGTAARREIWPDITNPATRTLIATHVAAQVAESGTHGIGLTVHGELDPSTPYAAVLISAADVDD
jgi:hypothetical protein